MKTIFTLCFISLLFISSNSFSQGIVLLPSAGIQTTSTNISGYSPFLKQGKQHETTPTFSLRAYNNTKSGFFVGFSTINSGLHVQPHDRTKYSGFGNWVVSSRLEAGYQWTSRPLYLSGNKTDGKNVNGLFLQFQPMLGFGYNLGSRNSGGTTSSDKYQLRITGDANSNVSLLTGGNIYLGTKGKPFLFISVMRNSNFGGASERGTFTTTDNNTTYTQFVNTKGSGTSFSIGVPIRIGSKKKN